MKSWSASAEIGERSGNLQVRGKREQSEAAIPEGNDKEGGERRGEGFSTRMRELGNGAHRGRMRIIVFPLRL